MNIFIELSSESVPAKVLKIQDDEQEKGKNRYRSGPKADVFSIELKQWVYQRHQLRMTYIDEYKNLMLYLILSLHISPSSIAYNHASILLH